MSTNKPTKATKVLKIKSLIIGVTKHMPKSAPVVIAGKTYTRTEVTNGLQALADLYEATSKAKAGWLGALKAEKDGWTGAAVMVMGVQQLARIMFSAAPDVLNDFGIVLHKRAVTKAADKAVAVVKRKATQVARGTVLSKKEKAKIKGVVPTPPKV